MREKLQKLERLARQLDPDSATRSRLLAAADHYANEFLERLAGDGTYRHDHGVGAGFEAGICESPADIGELLEVLDRQVDRTGVNPASGGHVGYIPGGGVYPSALGDYLADVTNRFSGVSFASPGAARMEQSLVEWMAGLVGYPDNAGGDLTSGGSTANLSGIVTARDAMGLMSAEIPGSCIYMTRQVHHCVDKALRVAGLAEAPIRYVPMDSRYRMDAMALERMVRSDQVAGLKPWLVVASAGTTDTGAVDPLEQIAYMANAQGLWLHVDAAYGGFFTLSDAGRGKLKGIEQADSIVMDPHKGLFLPYGSGAVLVKNVDLLAQAHAYQANYMQDARKHENGYSPADLSAELSRPFRGLRLWLPLRLFGLGPFRAALEEKIWLARYFHDRLSNLDGWEIGPEPDLSVVTYRYLPGTGDADDFNHRLLQAVHDDGKVFITSTVLNGHYTLRLAVLHFRTHLDTVDYLLDFLVNKATEMDS